MEKVVIAGSYFGTLNVQNSFPYYSQHNRESRLKSVFSSDRLLLHKFFKQDEQDQEQQILTSYHNFETQNLITILKKTPTGNFWENVALEFQDKSYQNKQIVVTSAYQEVCTRFKYWCSLSCRHNTVSASILFKFRLILGCKAYAACPNSVISL